MSGFKDHETRIYDRAKYNNTASHQLDISTNLSPKLPTEANEYYCNTYSNVSNEIRMQLYAASSG